MRVALIDHYDSFSFNVIDWLSGVDQSVTVDYVAFDDAVAMRRVEADPCALVLSPGPGHPRDAMTTIALVKALIGRVPILGICLGHQILAELSGARILRGVAPHHGATRSLNLLNQSGILGEVTPGAKVATYNSLVVDQASLGAGWRVDAICNLGEVQAISCQEQGRSPAFGLQFHPESYLSECAGVIRRNWLGVVAQHSEMAPFAMPS